MINAPSYKDVIYSTTASTLNYYITDSDGNKIYQALAYKCPSNAYLDINITQVVNNYLKNTLPLNFMSITGDTITHEKANLLFYLYEAGSSELLETYNFLYCYDYDIDWNGSDMTLSIPINGHLDKRMRLFFTRYNSTNENINVSID